MLWTLCCASKQQKAGKLQSSERFPLFKLVSAQNAASIQRLDVYLNYFGHSLMFYTWEYMKKCLKSPLWTVSMSKINVEKSYAIDKGLLISHLKGVFHHGAIILLNTSLCQALSLRPDGSCSGTGQQQQESYWKVHKIGSGVCMFESVKNPKMYLKIKDGQCNGTVSSSLYLPLQIIWLDC